MQVARPAVNIDASQIKGLIGLLQAEQFTEEESYEAERWILAGDWSFKKLPVKLEYADFFPAKAKIPERKIASRIGTSDVSKRDRWAYLFTKFTRSPKFYRFQMDEIIESGFISADNFRPTFPDENKNERYELVQPYQHYL
jgi:hypothetical protein